MELLLRDTKIMYDIFIFRFTFQYGATVTRTKYDITYQSASFTFQYGATVTRISKFASITMNNLHSNMELLLLNNITNKFQLLKDLHSNMELLLHLLHIYKKMIV